MTRATCADCGEELWTAAEVIGLCSWCSESDDEPLDLEDQLDALLDEADRDDRMLPFCACGRPWSDCDGSRAGCRKRASLSNTITGDTK